MLEPTVIVPLRRELSAAFTALNRAWIERFFRLEESDWKMLRDPESSIVKSGGQIFFAMVGGRPVGTVADIRVSPTRFELAKMAVDPAFQGHGIGERLGRAAIEWARTEGADIIFLETNSALANAIRLYERLGFTHAPFPAPSPYARADVYMEMRLSSAR